MNKTMKGLMSVISPDQEVQQKKRLAWLNHHRMRLDFLKALKTKELKGREYSDAVVEWDSQHIPAFKEAWNGY